MNRVGTLLLVVWLAVAAGAAPPPQRFEKDIAAFEAADKTNPPTHNAILFLGASSIRKWSTLANDFPTHKVINRGFGGSMISDSVFYFDRIVKPYKPKIIVFYAGSNDIQLGKTPETVVNDFKTLLGKIEAALPDTTVEFISINASPSRWKSVEKVREANRLIAAMAENDKKLIYIDTFTPMLDSEGQPRPGLYLKDRLHPNANGYAIWTKVIAPYLDRTE